MKMVKSLNGKTKHVKDSFDMKLSKNTTLYYIEFLRTKNETITVNL